MTHADNEFIDQVCDQFENAWNEGQRPQIEEYLGRAPDGCRAVLLRELLTTELELRATAGDDGRVEDYGARFPDQVAVVHEAFGTTPTVSHAASPATSVSSDRRAQHWAMQVRCPHCHNPIEVVATDSLREIKCPSCHSLFSLLGSDSPRAVAPGKIIGHFELLEPLGTGGFGTVWKARDTKLERIVALKFPRRSRLDVEESEMFFREARAAAQLKHPNIVSVHEVGRDGDTVYIVSDYIEGLPLGKWMKGQKVTPREAATLCEKIARALHHAHEAGVVHRDLKPSNVILDTQGQPHVMDFGLAKREAGEITMTLDGQILGTPAYMSPEQARGEGHQADRRTDVYSLGVMLYQLLTGELPFRGSMRMLLAQVLEDEPPAPRKLNSSIPRDLETIALKCMEKDVGKRYASADDVADELGCYLRGEPIQARPIGRTARAWRWCKRNSVVAGLAAAVAIALLGGVVVSMEFAFRANTNARLADKRAIVEQEQRERADAEEKRASDEAKRAKHEAANAKAQLLRARKTQYLTRIESAWRSLENQAFVDAESALNECAWDLRGWEHAFLWTQVQQASSAAKVRTLQGHANSVSSVALSPDSLRIVSGGTDGTLKIWDAAKGQEVLSLQGHTNSVMEVAFSPDGKRIASGGMDKTLKIWDAGTGQQVVTFRAHAGPVWCVAFSPSGQRIATGSGEFDKPGEVNVWDAATGQELLTLKGHTGFVSSVAFSPDGGRIVSGSRDKTLKVWDAATGQDVLTLAGHTDTVNNVAFSPDGLRIVSGSSDNKLKLWDAAAGNQLLTLYGHNDQVRGVAFSPDGQRIVSGSFDKTLKIWDATTGQEVLTLKGHLDQVRCVAFSTDGRKIVSGSMDKTLKLWDAAKRQEVVTLQKSSDGVWSVAFSPDGQRIASGSGDNNKRTGVIKVWDAATGQEVETLRGHEYGVSSVAFSPDGRRIVSGSWDKTLKVWDSTTFQEVLTLRGHSREVMSVAFSPDSRRIVSGSIDKTLKIWDAATGQELLTLQGHTGNVYSVAFSPDGQRIVSGGGELKRIGGITIGGSSRGLDVKKGGEVKVWDTTSGQEVLTPIGQSATVFSVAFSPDGRRFVSGGEGRRRSSDSLDNSGEVKVWDAATGNEVLNLKGSAGCLAISPDGQRIVSASGKVWNAATGKEVLTFKGGASCLALSPDGRRIVLGRREGTISISDAPLGYYTK